MESLKELLKPKSFNRISYVAVISWIVFGVILLGIFAEMENSESRFDFRCAAESEKMDLVRGQCFEQYEKLYNKSGVPVYAFVILNFSLIGIVGVIYSQVVNSRVDQLLAANRRGDAERLNNDNPPERKRGMFVAYLCQLATRFAMGLVFIVLQTQVLYPANFPSDFPCQIATGSHAANGSSTSNIQNSTMYECHNQRATKKTFWIYAVSVVNGAFALVILIEIICILSRARKGKKFLEDSQFLADHLPPREEQDQELQQLPSLLTLIESLKESIKVNTERPADLKALFQKEHGETTRNEDLKIDSIYTNLVLLPERARYDFSGLNREDQLKVYPAPKGNSQPISREDIVDVENKKVLIVGRPGIGKTLFCTKFLRDWALNHRLFNAEWHFDFALLLKFRRFKSEEKLSLRELFLRAEFSPPECRNDDVWSYILKNPDKLLILFDGLDEFSDTESFRADQPVSTSGDQPMPLSALFYNIVEGNLLGGATVLTTTRPTAVSDLTSFEFQRTFEIVGFASEQVEEYVDNFTKTTGKKDTGKKIWQHISTNMNIFTLCYVPVNLFIVCSCLLEVLNFENLSAGVSLPTKLTHIYQMATKLFFFRHNEQYRDKPLHREIIESGDPPEFKPLARIAFDGIREKKLIFTSNEVSKDVAESALFHRLPDCQTAPFRHEAQFCFIHLTMQEFLAAKHVVDTMNEAQLRKFVADHIDKGEWQMVLQFVAGLLGDGDKPSIDTFTELLPETTHERDETQLMRNYGDDDSVEHNTFTCWPTRSQKHSTVTLMKCIYENNESGSVVQRKLTEIGFNAVDFSNCSLAPADCTAVVHVLKTCQQISLINLYDNNIGSLGCVEIVKLFDNSNCQLSSLNLGANNITDEGVKQLSNALVNNNCQLSSLNLGYNNITDEGVKQLSNALVNNNCQLSSLNLEYNNITAEGVKQLSNALVNNNCQLSSLNLAANNITAEGVKQLSNALVNNNCQLSSLNLGDNNITAEGVKQLSNALVNNNCQLSSLNLGYNNITAEGVKQLSNALVNNNCQLSSLNLAVNNITDEGVKQLSNALVNNNCQLSSLNLAQNNITDEGVKQLGNALVNNNCQLSSLNLAQNNITDEGVKQLSNALVNNNCQLSSLNLAQNNITDEGVTQLSNALVNNNKLRSLYLIFNFEITDEAKKQIQQANPSCKVTFI